MLPTGKMLVLYYFAIFLLANVSGESCSSKDQVFNCDNQNNVLVGGIIMPCPKDFICNKDFIMNENKTCDLCIPSSGACTATFKCVANAKLVTINGYTMPCPEDTVCNKAKLEGSECKPCVREKCTKPLPIPYTCDETDKTNSTVILFGVTFPCGAEKECNKLKEKPCTPCIKKLDNTDKKDSGKEEQ